MADREKEKSNFLMQGSILAVAGIISRIIGLLYRIPMLSIIGEDGMGVYSTAYSIYNILLFISSYSLPMAVSKLIAGKLSLKEYRSVHLIFMESLVFGAVLGLAAALVMWFGAGFLADSVMEMPEAAFAIRALAPAVFIMGLLGVMRGFFQGHGTMVPTAVSQVLEQILHVAISLIAGYFLFRKGLEMDTGGSRYYASAYGAMGATIGTGAGALSALLFLLLLFLLWKKTYVKRIRRDRFSIPEDRKTVLRLIAFTAFPFLVSATMSNIGNVIDQSIFAKYIGTDYKAVWGVYTSKYTVLINVPIAIASAMSSSTIPTISGLMAKNDVAGAMKKAADAVRFVLLIAIPASVGLGVLGKPCFDLLFRSTDNTLAGQMMAVGSAAVLTFSLSTVTVGILQGAGMFWEPIKNYAIAMLIHFPLLALSLWVLKGGILMVVVNHAVYSLISCILNIRSLHRRLDYRQEYKKSFGLVGVCSVLMGLIAFALYKLCRLIAGNTVSTAVSVAAALAVYAVLLLFSGAVGEKELAAMPKGRLLIRAAERLHLIRKPEGDTL